MSTLENIEIALDEIRLALLEENDFKIYNISKKCKSDKFMKTCFFNHSLYKALITEFKEECCNYPIVFNIHECSIGGIPISCDESGYTYYTPGLISKVRYLEDAVNHIVKYVYYSKLNMYNNNI